uniref:Cadherin domain-containing protein n=1 Tax=Xenopus tropicalis TaxID=8364 RepID=A0A6I8SK45_XENTR
MKSQHSQNYKAIRWQVTFFFLLSWLCQSVSGQIHYSIAEELRKDSVIANLANDLGLDIKDLSSRRFHSHNSKKYASVDLENGNLYINDRIDRETLCRTAPTCLLSFDAVLEKPLNIFTVKLEIQDINDNPPRFFHDTITLEISESTLPGTHLVLQTAEDPDIGINSVQRYILSDNQFLSLKEKIRTDGSKIPELVLEKYLDRETQSVHKLFLTAFDGGNPVRSGSALIKIIISDANDNIPEFSKEVYKVKMSENTPVNTTVLSVDATDKDEGLNAQITYSFSKTSDNQLHTGTFDINPTSGKITTKRDLDFESVQSYEIAIEAMDGGGFVAQTKVLIEIIDENDNAPEISIASLSAPIPEDSMPGTVIALIKVHDQDTGRNGEVDCQILGAAPFQIVSSSSRYYRIITASFLDREKVPWYNITILATDKGSPELSSTKSIKLDLSDVNDNPPVFSKPTYVAYLPENNLPGSSIYRIQAFDFDSGNNAKVVYSILNTYIQDIPVSAYFSINVVSGVLYAQRSFDYEQHQMFSMEITARDSGSPPLNSNITLIIYIIDQNDNAPEILYPSPNGGGSSLFEMVPLASEQGSLITKVIAVDADSGHNSWLSYHFIPMSDPSPFSINQYTGEIRTCRVFQEKDLLKHKVVIMVKDNGHPSLSVSVTLSLVVADHFQQVVPKINNQSADESQSNLQMYLVVAVTLISLLLILTVILTVISKCKESKPLPTLGPLTTSLYPQVDSRMLSQFNCGTLPLPYSYNVCLSLDSSESGFPIMKPKQNVPIDNLIDADNSELRSEHFKETLSPSNPIQHETNRQFTYETGDQGMCIDQSLLSFCMFVVNLARSVALPLYLYTLFNHFFIIVFILTINFKKNSIYHASIIFFTIKLLNMFRFYCCSYG